MKALKILGILALGAGVLVLGSIALGLIASLMHVVIPLAVIFGVGYLAYHFFFAGKGPDETEKKDGDAKKEADKNSEKKTDASESSAQAKGPMTDADALREFEEHRKKLQQ